MFTSQDNGTTKKVFQKPNILRKKPKAKRGVQIYAETLGGKPLIKNKPPEPANINPKITTQLLPVLDHGARNTAVYSAVACINESARAIHTNAEIGVTTSEVEMPSKEVEATLDKDKQNNSFLMHDVYMIKPILLEQQDNDNEEEQGSLNIESFLVDSPIKLSAPVSSDSCTLSAKNTESEVENKWCLNFMSDDSKDIVTPSFYDGAEISKVNSDININPISFSNDTSSLQASSVLEGDIQSCLSSRVVKYKCNMPNCNKSFCSEARLQKHQAIHSKKKTNGPNTVECPVKKVDSEGVEQRCGQVFPTKVVLVKHLNKDHDPEDASYRCVHCERRFWWATGMRAHLQTPCTGTLTCTWEGCGRVFRQPCRLREHARAHTGDRPYPCDYPGCGWAFRSASKLMRHARRHTGERKHECTECGRAFPRGEHLRDHIARHHARDPTPCTHAGCDETFANTSLLYLHMKRAHRPDGPKPAPKKTRAKKKAPTADVIVVTLGAGAVIARTIPDYSHIDDAIETANASAMIMPESQTIDNDYTEVEESRGVRLEAPLYVYDLEGKCARTHCTWPLQRMEGQPEPAYTIEEDSQVEPSEGSESNIYTVRSDLFLHGNVLINEDSDFIIRESSNRAASEAEETSNTGQLDGLDLINSHPTIDLMQEELMYGDDAAVDESSFRVFLMNGEELS